MNDSLVYINRRVADIFVPSVEVTEDSRAMRQMFELHMEQKQLFNALVEDDACFEDVIEALESYIGHRYIDDYLKTTERQLINLVRS